MRIATRLEACRITVCIVGNYASFVRMKPIFNRRIINVAFGSWCSADSFRSISIGFSRSYIATFIILVNEGFVKRFVVFSYQLTEGIVNIVIIEACIYAVNLVCDSS